MDAGAHFFKTDLQVHTPRDAQWKGARPRDDAERRAWADGLVAACRSKGVGAVAITDHHDFALLPYVRRAATSETDNDGKPLEAHLRLTVFPGLELTLSALCQALLVLDADFPEDRLDTLLDVLAITPVGVEEVSYGDVTPLAIDDLGALHARLDEYEWLRGRYVVLPNVGDGAHQGLIRKNWAKKYIDMPCVGGYVDGSFSKLGKGNREILAGKTKEWGNKRVAVFATSDARSADFGDLGGNPTWIKWSTPTAEALRQACLAQESRVALEEPELPGMVVTALRVSNSQFMGPIELQLNPQYNAFIGGRGTGKSTCLEYLRWALCDQPPDGEGESDFAERRRRLITNTLVPPKGQVEVHFVINGIRHVVRRSADTGDVMLKVGDEEMARATPDDVRSLLPIEAYGQKQLSSVGVRLDELVRFVAAPIRDSLSDLDGRESGLADQIRENYAQLERYRSLTRAIARDEFTLDSLRQQAESLRESLGGLSEDDRLLIASKPRYDDGQELVNALARRLESATTELENTRTAVARQKQDLPAPGPNAPEAETLAAVSAEVQRLLQDVESTLSSAADRVAQATAPESKLARERDAWRTAYEQFNTGYTAAAERSTAHKSRLKELEELEQRQRELRESVTMQKEQLAELGDPKKRHDDLRAEWRGVQAEKTALIGDQCKRLTQLSDGAIRATLAGGSGTRRLLEPLRDAASGSRTQGAKLEKLLERVADRDDSLLAWHEALDELEQMALVEDRSKLPAPTSAIAVLSAADLQRLISKFEARQTMELGLVPIDDHPTFEYRSREDDYIPFKDASAGQQATALLGVLLNQDGPPLVIDQPEDDLDSKVIQAVVEQLWKAKTTRQLIFSSHNANLVVNGDAELVVCCDYRSAGDQSGGQIKATGAIDIPGVRSEITSVMEGGEPAFRLRKEKYGF